MSVTRGKGSETTDDTVDHSLRGPSRYSPPEHDEDDPGRFPDETRRTLRVPVTVEFPVYGIDLQ